MAKKPPMAKKILTLHERHNILEQIETLKCGLKDDVVEGPNDIKMTFTSCGDVYIHREGDHDTPTLSIKEALFVSETLNKYL